jgi:hypothetical protein
MDPYPILYIEHGVAYIPMWQWDSGRDDIFGYPVRPSVTDGRHVPSDGRVNLSREGQDAMKPTFLLAFPNGWTAAVGFNTNHPLYSAPAPGVYMTRSATATIFTQRVADTRHDESLEQSPVDSLEDLLRTIRSVADRASANPLS